MTNTQQHTPLNNSMRNNTTPTGYAEMFEWADKNPRRQDRAAYSVVIDHNDKIRIAGDGDIPFGIVAGDNTGVHHISGANENEWHKKHQRDSVKRLIWEPQTMIEWVEKGYRHWYEQDRIPAGITPPPDAKVYDYLKTSNGGFEVVTPLRRQKWGDLYQENSRSPYLPRYERREWAIVIILGRALMRSHLPYNPNWISLGLQDLAIGDGIGECEHGLHEFLVK